MSKRRRIVPQPEEPGALDLPLSPATGSCGPVAPVGALILVLTLLGIALAPMLGPSDLALLVCQGGALILVHKLCDGGPVRARRCLSGAAGAPAPPHRLLPARLDGPVARTPSGGSSDASLLVDGHEFPVKELALIGRSEDCHICLDDPTLALYQAALVPCGGRICIVNLQGAELSVNGRVLSDGQLEPGDVIGLGRTTLVYYRDQVLVPAELPPRIGGPPVARLESRAGALSLRRSWYYWIGRNPQRCDLVVADPAAADRHALIAVGATGSVTLVDFTSPLGTRVNQRRSHFRTLADGDVLTIGQTPVTFLEHP